MINKDKKKGRKIAVNSTKVTAHSTPNIVSILGLKYHTSKMKNDDTVKTVIKTTTDYERFKPWLPANRDIDNAHVDHLMGLIQEDGQKVPIIVNEKDQVIEGQQPVAYMVCDKASIKDTRKMNNSQKSWKFNDYLKSYSHHTHYNHLEYTKIVTFIDDYSLNNTVSLTLLCPSDYVRGRRRFKEGDFQVENLKQAQEQAETLLKIKAFAPDLVRIVKFCIALFKASEKITGFKMAIAIRQIEKNRVLFATCNNQESWLETLTKSNGVYNKGLNKTLKITNKIVE